MSESISKPLVVTVWFRNGKKRTWVARDVHAPSDEEPTYKILFADGSGAVDVPMDVVQFLQSRRGEDRRAETETEEGR